MKFIEDMSPGERERYFEERRKIKLKQEENIPDFSEKACYRCEQFVVVKSGDIIASHADTKREFAVHRENKNGVVRISVEMTDNIIEMKPHSLTEAIKLMTDFDLVKCGNASVLVNSQTGKIDKILNHAEIISKWTDHKNELYNKYGFLRAEENRKKIEEFITLAEQIVVNEKMLINDFNTKLFYDLFFDKYLVTKENLFEPYSREFYSNLFEGVKLGMDFTQEVLKESPDMFFVRKKSKLNPSSFSLSSIKDIYDRKFKPQIKYKFSEYDYSFNESTVMSTNKNYWIEESQINIIERVKNNIEVFTDYKLKKIE